jgi:outer membrane protein assembly factor BamB
MVKRSLLFVLFLSLLVPAVYSGQADVKVPQLKKPIWQRPLNLDKEFDEPTEAAAKAYVEKALAAVANEPIVPGFSPLVAGRIVVYRTYSDVRSVALEEIKGKDVYEAEPGNIYFKSTPMDGSLSNILAHKDLRATIENWLNNFLRQPKSGNLLYENSLLGRLGISHGLVYTVDDLSIPAPQPIFPWMWQQDQIPVKVKEYVLGNSLQAFELATGKTKWKAGNDPENDRHKPDDFTYSHFLGAPLDVEDKLYVLNEKNKNEKGARGEAELRLVCIDPKKVDNLFRPKLIQAVLSLGKVPEHLRITHNPVRRISSVELVHQDGVLVCPTNAGKVFGVDLKKMAVRWTYVYKKDEKKKPAKDEIPVIDHQAPIELNREWRTPGIFLHQDRLVFAAPDEGSLHCIGIKDGKLIWKAPRKDGLYVAGIFGDKVVVVGPKTCWAAALKDGQEQWKIDTGIPSGKGAAQGNIYYLPLRKSASSGKPGISLVDIAKGKILQTVDAAERNLPGNLLIHQDMLISQSATQIAAYAIAKTKK